MSHLHGEMAAAANQLSIPKEEGKSLQSSVTRQAFDAVGVFFDGFGVFFAGCIEPCKRLSL